MSFPNRAAGPSLRAVLFDLDGTLVDSAPDLGAAADAMRRLRGLPALSPDRYRPLAGSGARGMLAAAFGLTPEHPDYPTFKDEFFAHYERGLLERTAVFAGIDELLESLPARRLAWGIVTNKAARFSEPIARSLPCLSGAGVLVSGDTTAHTKPHPAPLLEAARRLGVEPQACLYVGDDPRDVAAGRAAGMFTAAACYGYLGTGPAPDAWGADFCIESPLDLLQWLPSA